MTFRIIMSMPADLPTKEDAERHGKEMAHIIFQSHPDFKYIELAKVEPTHEPN